MKRLKVFVNVFLFFQADDDTYAVMENLRHMLQAYNSSEPHWLGTEIKIGREDDEYGYLHGGPGYVMSIAALEILVTQVC